MVEAFFMWLLNFFSFSALQSLPWAVGAGIGVALANLYFKRGTKRTVWSTVAATAGTFYVLKMYVFFGLPGLTGLFGGYFWHLLIASIALAVGTVCAWQIDPDSGDRDDFYSRRARRDDTASATGPALRWPVGLAGVFVLSAVIVFSTVVAIVNDANTSTRAAIPNITTASATDNIPETDPNHIVMVTQSQAGFAGQQVIANAGNNLGSRFKTQPQDYTLMSIQHHLWWVAPLVYQNGWQQFSIWGDGEYDSPGYIRVDAENPNGVAEVKTGFHIHYSTDGWFSHNLYRYLYTHGFSNGNLVDATLELDDNWQPYWTVTLTQPKLTTTGDSVVKVIIVDAQSGKIQSYDAGKQPVWVDRIMAQSHVNDLVSDWARYLNAGWINPGGAGEMKPSGSPELVYNSVDKPVWLIPVTSNNNSDNSAVGIVLYSTTEQKGTFYPGVHGVGVGDAVSSDFASVRENIQHYPVESVQLYEIDGVPTWVAIYGQDHGNGTSSFAGIGFMDAKRLNSGNVIFAQDKESALARYADWLANNETSGGTVSQVGAPSKELTGKIQRINWTLINNTPTYVIIIDGDPHTYTATLAVNAALPLMQPGDTVTFSYLDTNLNQLPLRTLKDTTINR